MILNYYTLLKIYLGILDSISANRSLIISTGCLKRPTHNYTFITGRQFALLTSDKIECTQCTHTVVCMLCSVVV